MQRKIGKKYDYFGAKLKIPRPRPDLQWDATDKIDQYQCVAKISKWNRDLEQAKYAAEFKEQKQHLLELEQKVKEQEIKLNELRKGEYFGIKRLLKQRNESVDPEKSSDEMIELYECKLFDKRKALDRLRYEQNQLGQTYESQLKYLAEMQDRERYKESCQISDELKVKQLEFQLCNSDVQIRSYEIFLNDCATVINRLTEEALKYPDTLNYLENEVNEQNNILNAINKMGIPAYNDAMRNKKRLEIMEKRMQNEANKRQSNINSFKRNLLANEQNIFKHLPRDENFTAIQPTRYIQETASVLEQRLHHEKVEHDTKRLCDAAACANVNDLYTTIRNVFMKLKAGEEKVNFLENKLTEIDNKVLAAKQRRDELKYSIQQDDLDVRDHINKVNEKIGVDFETQQLIKSTRESNENELFKLQFGMQHLVDLMRMVNGERPMFRKDYPNEILSLPLFELHIGNYDDQSKPPETIEENMDKLIKAIFDRIKLLMDQFKNVQTTDDFWKSCEIRHEQLILQELDDD